MSSFDRRPVSLVLALALSLVVSACGFAPLYGQGGKTPETQARMAAVAVKPIPNRSGQMMRTELQRRLAPKASPSPLYALSVSLSESTAQMAVERNSFATRANLTLSAQYHLVRTADGVQLADGDVRAVASYNILSSEYATLVAEDDARKRAITAVAADIQTRLAVYFAGAGAKGAALPGAAGRP